MANVVRTFLFTDIEKSSLRWERFPHTMGDALARHDALLGTEISKAGGTIFKHAGDGACAVFADINDALDAAVNIQRRLAKENFSAVEDIRVRIALHLGVAEARGGDYFGDVVNRTARLLRLAHGGQILASEAVRDAVKDEGSRDGGTLKYLGVYKFDGLIEPERVFQLSTSGLQTVFAPLRSPDTGGSNLPFQATSFIGRAQEIAELRDVLGGHHLVTLLGPGGIGKTRLSLQAGAEQLGRFPDGVWLVELAGLTEPTQVAQSVAAVFNISLNQEDAVQQLANALLHRKLLLILDNCEHLIAGVGPLVEGLLRRCGNSLTILASSRHPIGVAGERLYHVRPLDFPPPTPGLTAAEASSYSAVQLFADRAALEAGAVLNDATAPRIAAICLRLDGIALAIELAAARIRMLQPAEILAGLNDRFRLLTGGPRTALPRHQTLRATIDWSFRLLSPSEQAALRRLSVFAGSFTLSGAAAVMAGDPVAAEDVPALVFSLLDASLCVRLPHPDSETRYRLLETTRHYALEKLVEANEAGAVNRRFASYLADWLKRACESWPDADTELWRAACEPEIDNLRAAIEWAFGLGGDTDIGTALVAHTVELKRDDVVGREHANWMKQALAAIGPHTPLRDTARLWFFASTDAGTTAVASRTAGLRAFTAFQELDDIVWSCRAAMSLGWALMRPGDLSEAQPYLDYVSRVLPQIPPNKHRSILLFRLALIPAPGEDRDLPQVLMREVIAIGSRFRDYSLSRQASGNLAELEAESGNYAAAAAIARDLSVDCRRAHDDWVLGCVLTNLAVYSMLIGDLETAYKAGVEAIPMLIEQRNEAFIMICAESLAYRAALLGDAERAAIIAGHTEAFVQSGGMQRQLVETIIWDRLNARLAALAKDKTLSPGRRAELALTGSAMSIEDLAAFAVLA